MGKKAFKYLQFPRSQNSKS